MNEVFELYRPHSQSFEPTASRVLPEQILVNGGVFKCSLQTLGSGPSRGVELLTIAGNRAGLTIVPTRGMGIWQAWAGETPFGWQSPVPSPVHPALVPIHEPSGLGWLSGFNELLVRCGLESNGAPEFDEQNRLKYPLHGRIANTPAESLTVSIDRDQGILEVTGVVRESRLFFANWTLTSTIRLQVEGNAIDIEDRVTNHADGVASHQLLYHINVGAPILGPGARLVAPFAQVVPKTPRASEGIEHFDHYEAPQAGFAEQVYLMQLQKDAAGWSGALLRDEQSQLGLGVRFDTTTLPYFVQWKNTGGEHDGYVTGLEPATNFPNTRSFEETHDRVVPLGPGESTSYRLSLHLLNQHQQVREFSEQLSALAVEPGQVDWSPRDAWCQ